MIKKSALFLSLLMLLSFQLIPANAALVSTSDLLEGQSREQLIERLEREDVRAQLVERGVDPQTALKRVESMTNEEVAQLNGQIDALPAGGDLSTIELLLIIIIIILLI